MKSLIYINGLFPGDPIAQHRLFETAALDEFEAAGIDTVHAEVDWRDPGPLTDHVDYIAAQAREMAEGGMVAIAGFSAEGSLAVHALHRLADNPDITAYSIAGRLKVGNYSLLNPRALVNAAHLGIASFGSPEYFLFSNSVDALERTVTPVMTDEEKSRLTIIKPKRDFVVPKKLMDIEGVQTITVPAYTHTKAAVKGLQFILERMKTSAAIV